MPLTPSYVYASQEDVEDILSAEGVIARGDDDASGSLNSDETALVARFLRRATHLVNGFLLGLHEASELAQSGIVNHWTAVVAAKRFAGRRGLPVPTSLKEEYEEAMQLLAEVRDGKWPLGDAAARSSRFPAYSNVRVDVLGHPLRKLRVERGTSDTHDAGEGAPRNYDLGVDMYPPPW